MKHIMHVMIIRNIRPIIINVLMPLSKDKVDVIDAMINRDHEDHTHEETLLNSAPPSASATAVKAPIWPPPFAYPAYQPPTSLFGRPVVPISFTATTSLQPNFTPLTPLNPTLPNPLTGGRHRPLYYFRSMQPRGAF
jgi:hypothetical protein